MRVRLLLYAAAAASAPAWLPSGPEASCLPDPFEGLDDRARENAEIAATALDATTVWTLDAADAAKFKDHARAATFGHITAGGAHALLAAARRLAGRPVSKLVDLGSGAGHVVIYAAALAPNVTATGHELAAGRHRAAVRARAALPSSIARRCVFVEGDMLRADVLGVVHKSNRRGASTPSTRRQLNDLAVCVSHHSIQSPRSRCRREMTVRPTRCLICAQVTSGRGLRVNSSSWRRPAPTTRREARDGDGAGQRRLLVDAAP